MELTPKAARRFSSLAGAECIYVVPHTCRQGGGGEMRRVGKRSMSLLELEILG